MIRLRHASSIDKKEAREVVLINSHDGTSAYKMIAGMLRFVCSNGLIVGDDIEDIRVPHKGDVKNRVIEGAYTVLNSFARVDESAEAMKALTLSPEAQGAFAKAALTARYDDLAEDVQIGIARFPVTTTQILRPRRHEDTGSDLWSVFNRVQENMIRGGLGTVPTDPAERMRRRMRTREVQGIDQNVKLNRALWTLADEMRKIMA